MGVVGAIVNKTKRHSLEPLSVLPIKIASRDPNPTVLPMKEELVGGWGGQTLEGKKTSRAKVTNISTQHHEYNQ